VAVTISHPAAGETVHGTIALGAVISQPYNYVRWYIDGALWQDWRELLSAAELDTTTLLDGTHTVEVIARVGNPTSGTDTGSGAVTFTVRNAVLPSKTAPTKTVRISPVKLEVDFVTKPGLSMFKDLMPGLSSLGWYRSPTSGTVYTDSSGRAAHGTLTGTITYNVTGPITGESADKALTFAGGTPGAYATLPLVTIPSKVGQTAVSYAAMAFWLGVGSGVETSLIRWYDSSVTWGRLSYDIPGQQVKFVSGSMSLTGGGVSSTGWNMAAIRLSDARAEDGSALGTYVELIVNGGVAATGLDTTGTVAVIGRTPMVHWDPGVANTALSIDEVALFGGVTLEDLQTLWQSRLFAGQSAAVWTNLSSRLRNWQIREGRDDELGRDGPTVLTAEVDNDDRFLEPEFGGTVENGVPNPRPRGSTAWWVVNTGVGALTFSALDGPANMVPNPSAISNLTGWTNAVTGGSIARVTGESGAEPGVTTAIESSAPAAAFNDVAGANIDPPYFPVIAGRDYRLAAWMKFGGVGIQMGLQGYWVDAGGGFTFDGGIFTNVAGWQYVSAIKTAPPGAVAWRMGTAIWASGAGTVSGRIMGTTWEEAPGGGFIYGVSDGVSVPSMSHNGLFRVEGGMVCTGSAHVYSDVASTAQCYVQFFDAAQAWLNQDVASSPVTLPANTWTRVVCRAVAPARAVWARVTPLLGTSAVQKTRWAKLALRPGDHSDDADPYVDGATAGYRWSGTADVSPTMKGGENQILPWRRVRLTVGENPILNPEGETGASGWNLFAASGTVGQYLGRTPQPGVTTALKATGAASTTNFLLYPLDPAIASPYNGWLRVAAGDKITMRAWVRAFAGTFASIDLNLRGFNATPTLTTESAITTISSPVTGTWYEIVAEGVVIGSTVAYAHPEFNFHPSVSGATGLEVHATAIQIAKTPTKPIYVKAPMALFTGYVERWPQKWTSHKRQRATITATDLSAVVASREYKGTPPAEPTGARVERLLNVVGFPASDRVVGTTAGRFTLAAEEISGNIPDLIREMAGSELGRVFQRGDGYMVFQPGNYRWTDRRSALPQAIIGDGGEALGEISYLDPDVEHDGLDIVNVWKGTIPGDTAVYSVASLQPGASIENFDRRESPALATHLTTTTALYSVLYDLLNATLWPHYRFRGLTLDGRRDELIAALILRLQLSDRVMIHRRISGGLPKRWAARVEGITLTGTADGTLTARLQLSNPV
jgi:hypothetical protein